MANATEQNPIGIIDIIYELESKGIYTDRKSIYRDIREINIINYMIEHNDEDVDVFEAEEAIEAGNPDDLLVLYSKSLKGYYILRRDYDLVDIKLIVEAINSAKFLSIGQAKRLTEIACHVISDGEAQNIKSSAFVIDRVRSDNKLLLQNIDIIERAMATTLDGKPHKPCPIMFDNVSNVVGKDKVLIGKDLIVNPYALVIFDGNYNLICHTINLKDDHLKPKNLEIYRVDEMYGVELLEGMDISGKSEFITTDLTKFFYQRYHATEEPLTRMTIKIHPMLFSDFVETFGIKDAKIEYTEDKQILYTGEISCSPFFYGFLLRWMGLVMPTEQKEIDSFKWFLENMLKICDNSKDVIRAAFNPPDYEFPAKRKY